MKIDLNCVRDTLLYLEEWLILTDELKYKSLSLEEIHQGGDLLKYPLPQLAYTLTKMEEAGFILAQIGYSSGTIYTLEVISLTYSGHQFLDTIRPESTWNKIHNICDKTGLKSVSAIMDIANILFPETIKSFISS